MQRPLHVLTLPMFCTRGKSLEATHKHTSQDRIVDCPPSESINNLSAHVIILSMIPWFNYRRSEGEARFGGIDLIVVLGNMIMSDT